MLVKQLRKPCVGIGVRPERSSIRAPLRPGGKSRAVDEVPRPRPGAADEVPVLGPDRKAEVSRSEARIVNICLTVFVDVNSAGLFQLKNFLARWRFGGVARNSHEAFI